MATDPYLSKQSVGGLVERCVNTPPRAELLFRLTHSHLEQ